MIELCQSCKDKNRAFMGQVVYLAKGTRVDCKKVIALHEKGKSINYIARAFGISSRRIWQILSDNTKRKSR